MYNVYIRDNFNKEKLIIMVKRSTFERLGAGFALATTVALGTTACGPETVSADNRPTASASQTPGASTPEKTTQTVDKLNPKTIIDSEAYKALSAEDQKFIKDIHASDDISPFENLKGPQRERYGEFLFRVYGPYAEQQIKLMRLTSEKFVPFANYGNPSSSSDAQSIIVQKVNKEATAWHILTNPDGTVRPENRLDAIRMLAIVYSSCDSQEYLRAKQAMLDFSGNIKDRSGSDEYLYSTAWGEESSSFNNTANEWRKTLNAKGDTTVSQWQVIGTSFPKVGGGEGFEWTLYSTTPEGNSGFKKLPNTPS